VHREIIYKKHYNITYKKKICQIWFHPDFNITVPLLSCLTYLFIYFFWKSPMKGLHVGQKCIPDPPISQRIWKMIVPRFSLSKSLLSSLICSDWSDGLVCCDWSTPLYCMLETNAYYHIWISAPEASSALDKQ